MQDLQEHLKKRGLGPGDNKESQGVKQIAARSHLATIPVALYLDDLLAVAGVCFSFGLLIYGAWYMVLFGSPAVAWLLWRVKPPSRTPANIRVVCISDTHGKHRHLRMPKGDLLIHAGDFTKFGNLEDAKDFNSWLSELNYATKIVVNGNHENNADWQANVESIVTNAIFLKDRSIKVQGLEIYGTDFCWPMRQESPLYAKISSQADIVVAHGPARGLVDGRQGCHALLWAMSRIRPRLLVSGHIHQAHGVCHGRGALRGTAFVNAANCQDGYRIGWEPIVLDL